MPPRKVAVSALGLLGSANAMIATGGLLKRRQNILGMTTSDPSLGMVVSPASEVQAEPTTGGGPEGSPGFDVRLPHARSALAHHCHHTSRILFPD